MIVLTPRAVVQVRWDNPCKALSSLPGVKKAHWTSYISA
jgi:hypothetical protein